VLHSVRGGEGTERIGAPTSKESAMSTRDLSRQHPELGGIAVRLLTIPVLSIALLACYVSLRAATDEQLLAIDAAAGLSGGPARNRAQSGAPPAAASVDQRFSAAMELYHQARYAAAYGRLIQLADDGHAKAARVALLMLRHGPALYRSQWTATPQQMRDWLDLASSRQSTLLADAGD